MPLFFNAKSCSPLFAAYNYLCPDIGKGQENISEGNKNFLSAEMTKTYIE